VSRVGHLDATLLELPLTRTGARPGQPDHEDRQHDGRRDHDGDDGSCRHVLSSSPDGSRQETYPWPRPGNGRLRANAAAAARTSSSGGTSRRRCASAQHDRRVAEAQLDGHETAIGQWHPPALLRARASWYQGDTRGVADGEVRCDGHGGDGSAGPRRCLGYVRRLG
jgi:hypothetical protein